MLARIFASHPDHLATGEATLCAVYPDSRNPRSFPEQLEDGLDAAHGRRGVADGRSRPGPAHRRDRHVHQKLDTLRAHESQTGHRDDLEEMLRGWLRVGAEAAGFADGRLAESFKVVATG